MESADQKTQYHQPWKVDQSHYRRDWSTRKQIWSSDMDLLNREKTMLLKPQSLHQYTGNSNQGLQSRFRDNLGSPHILQHLPHNNARMRDNIVFPHFYNHLGYIQQEGPFYGSVSSQWITAGTELIKLNPEPLSASLLKPPWGFIENSSFTERDQIWNPIGKRYLGCEFPPVETVRSIEQDFLRPSIPYTTSPDSKSRGPCNSTLNPTINHSIDEPEVPLQLPPIEAEYKSLNNSNASSPLSATKDLMDQFQDGRDDSAGDSEENFLLIDDRGIPYTVFKKDLLNEEYGMDPDDRFSQIPKRFHYCPVCSRSFLYLSDLERHSITHSERKPHECKVCGKSFKRSSHLQRHKHIHTGERPYQCVICQKGFRESGELQRHQRVHTGEKPYQCDICHLRFTERNTLRRHTKRKHSKEMSYKQDTGDSSDWAETLEDLPAEDNIM
ncbi:hypothetical protein GDO86_012389 [Hymenochirus boettgeri]|uniref:C2H2-type domain-containing protein n=1 Tax=Hymenochirus boettgeri TaxID=247094 RepID=A0A8T2IR07_9PIPI|nr:hypothetical protein GDO86_012389 [Hymenochirus boettgeri]